MSGITQQILANPGKYSVAELQRGIQDGVIPAYIGIPLLQDKMQKQKQAQAAGAGQQGQQPPLAEQVMAEASQAGVDQLPSNLPQSYASGGIIAFDDGGQVEHFQVGGPGTKYENVYDRYNREKNEAAARADAARAAMTPEQQVRQDRAAMAVPFAAAGDIVGGPYNYLAQTGSSIANAIGVPRMGKALGIYGPDVTSVGIPQIGHGGNTPFMDMAQQYANGQAAPAGQPAPAAPQAAAPTPQAAPPAGPGIAALPGAGAGQQTPPQAATGIGGLGGAGGDFGMPAKPKYDKSLEQSAREEFDTLGQRSDARLTDLTKAQEGNKLQGKAYDELKTSLEEEAKAAGSDKAEAKAMALFKAGLAMMGGTSQYALENIGKGAMVGAEDYQRAAIDLKKADKERQKQFAAIEQARRAEDQDDIKLRNSQLDKAYTAKQRMDELGTSAIMAGTGKDRDTANEIWKTEYGGAKSVQIANIGAGATRYAADRAADSRVQAAELRAAMAGATEKGGLTQDQIIKWRTQLADSPEITAFKNDLIKQFGKNVVTQPQFQQAVAMKTDELLAKMANRNPGALAGPTGQNDVLKSYLAQNPSLAQYFKQ